MGFGKRSAAALLAAAGLLGWSCGSSKKAAAGAGSAVTSTTVSGMVYQAGSVAYLGGVLAGGIPVGSASVRVNGADAGTTNEQGYFSVSGLSAGDRVSLCFSKADYTATCRNVRVVAGRGLLLDPTELRDNASNPDFATASITGAGAVSSAGGNAEVSLPSATICRADRLTPVAGSYTCSISPLDPADPAQRRFAPGSFEGRTTAGATVSLVSGGMMDISCVEDATQLKVNVCTGKVASVRIPIYAACADTSRYPATIQSWAFDEATGLWVEDLSFAKTCAGDVGYYAGTASHFSYWNADQVAATACVTGRVLATNGVDPVAGARVRCEGTSYGGSSEAFTGDDGRYCIAVMTGGTADCAASKGSFQAAAFTVTAGATAATCGGSGCQAVGDATMQDPLIRSALTWGLVPDDLDSHWVSVPPTSPDTHVYYGSSGSLVSTPYAELDTDDTSSYGPEVITVMPSVAPGTYRYCIHDYTNGGSTSSTQLAGSGAQVELVLRGGARQYAVPAGAGTVWQVFELVIDASRNVTVHDLDRVLASAGGSNDALALCRAN